MLCCQSSTKNRGRSLNLKSIVYINTATRPPYPNYIQNHDANQYIIFTHILSARCPAPAAGPGVTPQKCKHFRGPRQVTPKGRPFGGPDKEGDKKDGHHKRCPYRLSPLTASILSVRPVPHSSLRGSETACFASLATGSAISTLPKALSR